jgi:hypothetical protein
VPAAFSDHQASIILKTALPRLVTTGGVSCYLDSDQVAISSDVDSVFELYASPIMFAADHTTMDRFSASAVNCGCASPPCDHLRRAIYEKFEVQISDPAWAHWNGGLFLFDRESIEFASAWQDYSLLAFEDLYWRVRDQGTLAATTWRFGLEHHPTLPQRFNRVVDRFRGHPERLRGSLSVADYTLDDCYDLGEREIAFLHFINGGVGCRGWKNWDDVETLLARPRQQAAALLC